MKQYLKKIKSKMPPAPGKEEEDEDMLQADLDEGGEPEAGESPEHEAGESPEFEAGEHEEAGEAGEEGFGGMPEGTPEEEAAEPEAKHTAELSDEALLAEVKKRGLMGGKPVAPKKAVAVSKDLEEDTGY